jgi:hypothetical protein
MHIATRFDRLINLPVSHVWFGDHGALFLELGRLEPETRMRRDGSLRNPQGEVTIMADCDWRIESKLSILAGRGSSARRLEGLPKVLLSNRVVSVTTLGVLPELFVEFTGKLRLLTFSKCEGQPDWSILFNTPKEGALGVQAGRVHRAKGDA